MKFFRYFTEWFWALLFFILVAAVTAGTLISDYMMQLRGLQ